MDHWNYDALYERRQLSRMAAGLVGVGRYDEADYVLAIVRTDAAETGLMPHGERWPTPGQDAPDDWFVYKAVLDWCCRYS
jgi:hypothetical protein